LTATSLLTTIDLQQSVMFFNDSSKIATGGEKRFAPPLDQMECDLLRLSHFPKKTVDKSIWAVTVFGEWQAHRNMLRLQDASSSMVYLETLVFGYFWLSGLNKF